MTLRRPCEHDRYDAHGMSPYGKPSPCRPTSCPGGEFLPEDALVIEKVDGQWPVSATKAIYDVLAEGLDNERDRLYLADVPTIYLLDALAADQVGEPG